MVDIGYVKYHYSNCGFFLPLLSKYREGWLELHIKILFQVPLCCFYSFSPFRLLSRNTCICSKCLSLYTFTMMVREIGRSISPGKNHISRGLRPRAIWFFWGYKSSYFPNVHAIKLIILPNDVIITAVLFISYIGF